MQKKLLTLAVAAAMAAPAAAMAEATLYGKLNMSIDYADVNNSIGPFYEDPNGDLAGTTNGAQDVYLDANGNPIVGGGQNFEGWGVSREGKFIPSSSRANRIGVKGSEDLGNGLKAIYQVELGLNLSAADDDIDERKQRYQLSQQLRRLGWKLGYCTDRPPRHAIQDRDRQAGSVLRHHGGLQRHRRFR